MRDLLERVAVVTGPAGGIGLAVAQQLATAGCRLALVDVARLAPTLAARLIARYQRQIPFV